ncbi:sodium-dependent transporter [Streptomyces sp. NPDC046978]|uniref:sodium-dependent transporter n=1 Tax=Streptomyces sp. NPDC046978 TaxID=3154704 RepID=UPI003405A9F7
MTTQIAVHPTLDGLTNWLRRWLGFAVLLAYIAAVFLPGPGLWLRRARSVPLGAMADLTVSLPPLLLALVLFAAGLQVPVRALGGLLRRPKVLLVGLILHLLIPLLAIPAAALLLRQTPDTDGGSGLITSMILIVAMPVAAGATVVLPCAAGVLCRLVLPVSRLSRALGLATFTSLISSLVLTYTNACGALGSFLASPRLLLLAAALTVAALVCTLSFVIGHFAARLLRLDSPVASSLTLACGMNNSSASAVLITTTLPDKPHLLLPVLVYGLLQKAAASRVVRGHSERSSWPAKLRGAS